MVFALLAAAAGSQTSGSKHSSDHNHKKDPYKGRCVGADINENCNSQHLKHGD
eukprot:CAMPEP_0117048688 /NCGR_PEP_ID=MMETSP0472-20121206/33663_1 /TAXON_ID=693140 ORGANISM="Tiarina fusus, Strain LIS" /NCGR_SAMPLE_ID=MMETSP0472 /ASSEMBLY_ACC=CAM_ASM_000603 /LENGTH=52 /DNA_ID=CAMNT_0004761897 /DNA_START=1 /DNA_END=159 /DNA_ORIENTATION=+